MTLHEGLSNFVKNIEPTIRACRDRKKLTPDQQEQIVQFYLEVLHYLNEEKKAGLKKEAK